MDMDVATTGEKKGVLQSVVYGWRTEAVLQGVKAEP